MTALNTVVQPKFGCVHIATDGAHYLSDGIVQGIAPKTFPVPSWPGVVAARGPSFAPMIVGQMLALKFQSFDSMVEGVSDALPGLLDRMFLDEYDQDSKTMELIFAGYSKSRGTPEAYFLRTGDALPPDMTAEEVAAVKSRENVVAGSSFQLIKLPPVANGPLIDQATMQSTGYEGICIDDKPEQVIRDLRTCLEVQRHIAFGDQHLVGGVGHVLTVDKKGITTRELCRWGDQIGEPITPEPIDWKAWHAQHGALANVDLTSLSRLQRERMLKKAKKGTL